MIAHTVFILMQIYVYTFFLHWIYFWEYSYTKDFRRFYVCGLGALIFPTYWIAVLIIWIIYKNENRD